MQTRNRLAHAALSCLGQLSIDAIGLDHSADGKVTSLAARNLTALADMLAGEGQVVCAGYLFADGKIVASTMARADGKLALTQPPLVSAPAHEWTFAIDGQEDVRFRVTMVAGELGDDDTWIIKDATSFYEALLGEQKPVPNPAPRPPERSSHPRA